MEAVIAEVPNPNSDIADGVLHTPLKTEETANEVQSSESEVINEQNVAADRELSWEKLAAEISADDIGEVQTNTQTDETVVETESVALNEDAIEETVINTVTDEKIVTESDLGEGFNADEQIAPLKLDAQNEPLLEDAREEVVELPETNSLPEQVVSPEVPVQEFVESEEIESIQEPLDKSEETVTICELKSGEESTATEEIQYTIVEADHIETHETIEEHLAQTTIPSDTESVVIINPDKSQMQVTIEEVPDAENDESQQSFEEVYVVSGGSEELVDDPVVTEPEPAQPVKPKKPRGRKPITDIPLHVLGRDISKPIEGVSNGGRTMPKPRLGVKVPYRNLTSQIVSKQDIEKEIMDRFKQKQEQNTAQSGDVLFARKLTQRLAKKLIPAEKSRTRSKTDATVHEAGSSTVQREARRNSSDNSDLIAILEGEGDDIDLTKQKADEETKVTSKQSEREIALQQLRELPGKSPPRQSSSKEDVPKSKSTLAPSSHKTQTEKKPVDLEPRLKTGMVIKTYTRKRKSTELETFLPPKKPTVVQTAIKTEDGSPSNVYMTKSSRVIKRKVIWDPDDEAVMKSPNKQVKVEASKSPASASKVVEKKEKETVEKFQERKSISPTKKLVAKSPLKKGKRLTEIDKLLMDEGAVNMLYDVKNNEEASPTARKKQKSVISLDKAHKELMSKTSVIKNDLQQNTNVQKTLRKKDIASPSKNEGVVNLPPAKKESPPSSTRKKSKDSVRSSLHSPPASPFNVAEASRIIRRHSSSSFSSIDDDDEDYSEERMSRKKSSGDSPKKKVKKSSGESKKEVTKNNNNSVTEGKTNHVEKSTVGQYTSFKATKKNKIVAIQLQNVEGKCYLNQLVLRELTSCLKECGNDRNCHVVSITSDCNESFCEGLDYSELTADDEPTCKKKANEVASLVKGFLRCLVNFPKVLVAGIQGCCVGLGVTMLPLFDMVIASDTSTFTTPYSRLGCVPEAGFLLSVPHLNSNGLASELLYTSQSVKADDAFRRGLVTRLCWPEKYQQELKGMLSQIANQKLQSLVATKQQLRQNVLQSAESAISAAGKVLVEYWTNSECQKNFTK